MATTEGRAWWEYQRSHFTTPADEEVFRAGWDARAGEVKAAENRSEMWHLACMTAVERLAEWTEVAS